MHVDGDLRQPGRRTIPTRADWALGTVVLLLSGGALLPLWRGGEAFDQQGDPLKQALWLALTLVAAVKIARMVTSRRTFLVPKTNVTLVLSPAILAMLSVIWSVDPALTFRRAIALGSTVVIGMYLGMRFFKTDLARLVVRTSVIAASASLVLWIALPQVALFDDSRATSLAGIFSHKNELGTCAAIGILAVIALQADRGHRRPFLYTGIGLLLMGTLFLSRSSGALAATVSASLGMLMVWGTSRLRGIGRVGALLIGASGVAVILLLVTANSGDVATFLGRDPTLTGRTDIWTASRSAVSLHPWLGYGYGAWSVPRGPLTAVLEALPPGDGLFLTPTHPHNALLFAWIHLGFAGVLIYVSSLFAGLRLDMSALGRSSKDCAADASALMSFGLVAFIAIQGIVESNVFVQNYILTMIWAALMCRIPIQSNHREFQLASSASDE